MAFRFTRNLLHRHHRLQFIRRYSEVQEEETEAPPEKKGIIIGTYIDMETNEHTLTTVGQKMDALSGGMLKELLSQGKPLTLGKSTVFQSLESEFQHVAVVGLGEEGSAGYNELEGLDEFKERARLSAAIGAKRLRGKGVTDIYVESFGNAEAAAEGAVLSTWLYQDNKDKEFQKLVPKLHLYDGDVEGWERGVIKAKNQNIARKLSDTPANLMTPAIFAQNAVDYLCPCGITVEVRDRDWADQKKMNGFLAIAKGSCEPPVVIELGYCGGSTEEKPIALVGKGVTFDSGGLCFKKCEGMDEFRGDMAGAAVIVATMRAAANLSLPLNLQAVIPLCENMPSGMATKPGDIVQSMNGTSVRIDDTDNEGRIILADLLAYAYQTFRPTMIVDVATMTRGIQYGLGDAAAGAFTNNEGIWRALRKAGSETGDRVWRMPLWKYFTQKITSTTTADMTNLGTGPGGGPCQAAAFLREFVHCTDWLHLDIRNVGMVAQNEDIPYYRQNRMTGRPTRTLIQYLYNLASERNQNSTSKTA